MKKRLLALFVMLSLAATFVFPAFAADPEGSQNNPYPVSDATGLKTALGNDKLNELFGNSEDNTIYIKLDADIELDSTNTPVDNTGTDSDDRGYASVFPIELDESKTIMLNLNGYNIDANSVALQDTQNCPRQFIFRVSGGNLVISNEKNNNGGNNGQIIGKEWLMPIGVVGNCTDSGATVAKVNVKENVTVECSDDICAYIIGDGAELDVYGTLNGGTGIQGNGNYTEGGVNNGNTVINVQNSANITATDTAIYHPQVGGELNIYGGTITGKTGIEMRAGILNVSGGTITGTADTYTVNPNGNGSTTEGAGIAVAQHTTKEPIDVTVSGGTIKGYTAFSATNPEGNSLVDIEKVKINLNGGTFTGDKTNGHDLLVIGNNKATLAKEAILTNNKICTTGVENLKNDKGEFILTTTSGTVNLPADDESGYSFTAKEGNVVINNNGVETTIYVKDEDKSIDFSNEDVIFDTSNAALISAVAQAVAYSGASKVIDLPSNSTTTGTTEPELIAEIRKANPTIGFYKSLSGSITTAA